MYREIHIIVLLFLHRKL